MTGRQRRQRQRPQARGSVQDDVLVLAGQAGKLALKEKDIVCLRAEYLLLLAHQAVGRYHGQGAVGPRTLAQRGEGMGAGPSIGRIKQCIPQMAAGRVGSQRERGIGLRVGVDKKDRMAESGQTVRNPQRGSGLALPALVVGKRYNLHGLRD